MCMHFCNHDFAKWELDTKYMTRIEKSIYLDMRTLVLTEKGITSDLEMLYRHLNVKTDEEIEAVTFLLRDKFKLDKRSNTYKHKDWEQELKNYKHSKRKKSNARVTERNGQSNATSNADDNANSNESNADSNAQRQAKLRQERKQLKAFLSSKDVDIKGINSVVKLRALAKDNGYDNEKNITDNAESNATSNADDNAQVTENNATNSSHNKEFNNSEFSNLKSNKKEKNKKEKVINFSFEEFWDLYDYKVGRNKALKSWNKLSVADKKAIMKHVPSYVKATPDRAYRKHPTTYLNNQAWEDEIVLPSEQKPQATHPSHQQFAPSEQPLPQPQKQANEPKLPDPRKYVYFCGEYFYPLPNMTTLETHRHVMEVSKNEGQDLKTVCRRLLEKVTMEKVA